MMGSDALTGRLAVESLPDLAQEDGSGGRYGIPSGPVPVSRGDRPTRP